MPSVKIPVSNKRQPGYGLDFHPESPIYARLVAGRASRHPLAQPLHGRPDAQCLALAGVMPVRGGAVVLPGPP